MTVQAKKAIGFYFTIQMILFLAFIYNRIVTTGLYDTISNPESLIILLLFFYSLYIQFTYFREPRKNNSVV